MLLVISDAHEGLKEAIRKVFGGSSWQRCRVHFMRNLLSQVPKSAQQMVAALVRTIFAQPDKTAAHVQLADVVESLRTALSQRLPRCLKTRRRTFWLTWPFPSEHWRQLHSTNPLERLMREIGRRTDVVGIFPNRASLIRLAGAVLDGAAG